MGIDQKMERLSPELQESLQERVTNVLHDRYWFACHQIDYSDPDVPKVRETVFREEYQLRLI